MGKDWDMIRGHFNNTQWIHSEYIKKIPTFFHKNNKKRVIQQSVMLWVSLFLRGATYLMKKLMPQRVNKNKKTTKSDILWFILGCNS